MSQRSGVIIFILLAFLIASCATTEKKRDKSDRAIVDKESNAPKVTLSLMGDEPDNWNARVNGRSFQLTALSVYDSRMVRWSIQSEVKALRLLSPRKDINLLVKEESCTTKGGSFNMSVILIVNDITYRGCGHAEGESIVFKENYDSMKIEPIDQLNVASEDQTTIDVSTKEKREELQIEGSQLGGRQALKVSHDATSYNITFSGTSPNWEASLKRRAFSFNSMAHSESRRLSWEGSNNGNDAIIKSPDGTIEMRISNVSCNNNGHQAVIVLEGNRYSGCAIIH